MPTPRHLTMIASQIRAKKGGASTEGDDWIAGVIETADGNTTEKYTVLLTGTAGVVPATSSIDAPMEQNSPVWVTRVGGRYTIVGVK